MSHTPGPWVTQPVVPHGDEAGCMFVVAENLSGVVGVAVPCPTELDSGDFSRVEANGRLIAAAPDLLAALRAAQGYMRNAKIDLETGAPKKTALATIDGGLRLVDAAITKAEGRS